MINTVTLVGRLAADPELRYTAGGTAITTFNLAVNRQVKRDAPEGTQACDFIRCICWSHTAEFVANYLGKGRLAGVEGRLEINQWVDKEGTKRRDAQVNCRDVRALDKKPEETPENEHQKKQQRQDPTRRPETPTGEEEYGPDPFAEA